MSDIACKAPDRDLMYQIIDGIRSGAVLRLDSKRNGTTCIGDANILDQVAYALEKHMRQ